MRRAISFLLGHHLPDEFKSAGLMVPVAPMPFACCCTEYIAATGATFALVMFRTDGERVEISFNAFFAPDKRKGLNGWMMMWVSGSAWAGVAHWIADCAPSALLAMDGQSWRWGWRASSGRGREREGKELAGLNNGEQS